MEKLACFTVVKPQGIKGELKAKILADGLDNVKGIKKLYDESGKEYQVTGIKDAFGGFAFIKLSTVQTRNDAELLRDVTFYAQKSAIKKNNGDYFIADLLNAKIITDGVEFATVKNVIQSNVDMFEIELVTGKRAYFPFLKSLNLQINVELKQISVEKSVLDGVIYYED